MAASFGSCITRLTRHTFLALLIQKSSSVSFLAVEKQPTEKNKHTSSAHTFQKLQQPRQGRNRASYAEVGQIVAVVKFCVAKLLHTLAEKLSIVNLPDWANQPAKGVCQTASDCFTPPCGERCGWVFWFFINYSTPTDTRTHANVVPSCAAIARPFAY